MPTQQQRILAKLGDGEWHSTFSLAHPDEGQEILYPVCRKEDLEKRGYVIEGRRREGSAQKEWRLVAGPVTKDSEYRSGARPSTTSQERQPQPPLLFTPHAHGWE